MKDIKKMWLVTSDLNKFYVNVLYDKDSGRITHFCDLDQNDFYESAEANRFFSLEKDADDYIDERLNYLIEKDEEIMDLIAEMSLINKENKNIKYRFKTTRESWIWNLDRSEEESLQGEIKRSKDVISRLSHALKSGYLNIGANTLRVEDVTLIKWMSRIKDDKNEVEITLSNGKTINVTNETELDIIRYVYGENSSGLFYRK